MGRDSDIFLSYKKIYYHALEDGLNCILHYDTARYDNRGHFELKAKFAAWNLIFIQNGYAKYCIDMEVNDISCLKYSCPKYIEKSRAELVAGIKEEDKLMIISVFMYITFIYYYYSFLNSALRFARNADIPSF